MNEKVDQRHSEKKHLTESEKIDKIREIIQREFRKEIEFKEREAEHIDIQIAKARSLLKKVRYAVVASYYTNPKLKASQEEVKKFETFEKERNPPSSIIAANNEEAKGFLKQQPVHPSLKKLLGKKPIDYNEILSRRPPREAAKVAISNFEKYSKKKPEKHKNVTITHDLEAKIPKLSSECQIKIPRYVSPIKVEKEIPKLNSSRGKNQKRHLIVVGNISKYLGGAKNMDGVTHKWMVYIKSKDGIPLKEIVEKAKFYLHSSYKPHDVVDVESPNLQLTRLGWGEFPIRIELHFKEFVQQKPIQIIHNLTLDKTLSGLQTLGAETTVELWLDSKVLETVEMKFKKIEEEKSAQKTPEKGEDLHLDRRVEETKTSNIHWEEPLPGPRENDNEKLLGNETLEADLRLQTILQDHDYLLHPIQTFPKKIQSLPSTSNSLAYPHIYVRANDYEKKLFVEFQRKNFQDLQSAVEFLLEKLPLVDEKTRNPHYKKSFPFLTESLEVWNKFDFVKKAGKEWSRAKFIGNLLKRKWSREDSKVWTTKEIMVFGRRFGFSPEIDMKGRLSDRSLEIPKSTLTLSQTIENWVHENETRIRARKHSTDEIVNVESVEDTKVKIKPNLVTTFDKNTILMDDCNGIVEKFVDQTCREIGVKLVPEEIISGVLHCSSNVVLVTALKCFLTKLLKTANAVHYEKDSRNPHLSIEDIKATLMSVPEFDMFTNAGLGELKKTE